MTRREYIETFVINFVSVWTAKNYTDYCSRGLHKELENPPFEDALFLAQETWDKYNGFINAKLDAEKVKEGMFASSQCGNSLPS